MTRPHRACIECGRDLLDRLAEEVFGGEADLDTVRAMLEGLERIFCELATSRATSRRKAA